MKRLFLLLALFLPLWTMAQNVNLWDGLVVYYPFDGNGKDASGNGIDVSISPEPKYIFSLCELKNFEIGAFGYGKSISESSYATIYDHKAEEIQFPSTVSISFWFKMSLSWGKTIEKNIFRAGNNGLQVHISADGDKKAVLQIANDNGNGFETIIRGVGAWHHIVVMFTPTCMKLFIDNKEEVNKNINTSFFKSKLYGSTIGDYKFDCSIDEFRIYNRELTKEEMKCLYTKDPRSNYKDFKFYDNEPDYLLYSEDGDFSYYDYYYYCGEDNVAISNNTYCEATKRLYAIDYSHQNQIMEYDLSDIMNKKVVEHARELAFKVSKNEYKTIEVSPDGKHLAIVDVDGVLHIIDVTSGAETAKVKLGKFWVQSFAFQSNDEILLAGGNKAMLYNIAKKKRQSWSNKKVRRILGVTHSGKIFVKILKDSETVEATFQVQNGKISETYDKFCLNTSESSTDRIDDIDETGNFTKATVSFPFKNDYYYYFNSTGDAVSRDIAYSDGKKYTHTDNAILIPGEQSGLAFDHALSSRWLDNGRLFLTITKDGFKIYNHTLTDNEMQKLALREMIEKKDKEALATFIKENPNSQYLPIAYKAVGSFILKPDDYSAEHITEVQNYIKEYQGKTNVDAAKEELDKLYKGNLNSIGNSDIDGYANYIATFPESPYLNQAREKQSTAYRLSYEELCRNTEPQPYLDYAAKYPNSPYIAAIKERTKQIQEQKRREAEELQRLKDEEARYARSAYMAIKKVEFGNDHEFGAKLYASQITYLCPKIYYDTKCVDDKYITLSYKIIKPNGSMVSGSPSPKGYTHSERVTLHRGDNQTRELTGWGSQNKGSYYSPGTYRFELWYEDRKIYETTVTLHKTDEEIRQEAAEKKKQQERERQLAANSNISTWKLGNQVCVKYNGGILLGFVEKFNEDRSAVQVKVVAGPSGEYKGQSLKKDGMIWIQKGSGWHLAMDDEISYAKSHNSITSEKNEPTIIYKESTPSGPKTCSHCNGRGKIVCFHCNGTGRRWNGETCSDCRGKGEFMCPYCYGSGTKR